MMRHVAMVGILLLTQGAARGDTFLVTGSGTWASDAPTTALSAPDATWSFSYDETTPLNAFPSGPIGNPTNFSYELNGTPVAEPLAGVEYFATVDFGLLSLSFSGGDHLQLYGVQVYDASLSLIPGVYDAVIDANQTLSSPFGEGTGTVTISSVPEPASIALVGLGLGLVALSAARRLMHRRAV
jgi:hypothetical protein